MIAELATRAPRSIRLAGGADVALTPRVEAIIDLPIFQRLRQIRQLGPTHYVYPGATHTRFEHSLGVFGVACRFARALIALPVARDGFSARDLLALLASALLHDIGHYPFAHTLEAVHAGRAPGPRHEERARRLIEGSEAAGGALPEILRRAWGVEPRRVARLVASPRGDLDPIDRLLQSVISGAIDADKMDYLVRDSVHMGVGFGRQFDAERLLAALAIAPSGEAIAIDASGRQPAEAFVMSRYFMFSEAYWHHTVRAASAMVEASVAALDEERRRRAIEQAAALSDDAWLEALFARADPDSPTRSIIEGLVGGRRAPYKRIVTWSMAYAEPDKRAAYEAVRAWSTKERDRAMEELGAALAQIAQVAIRPGDLILDVPPRDKDALETIEILYPERVRGRRSYALHEASRIVAGIQSDFPRVVKKIRLFAHPSIAPALGAIPDLEARVTERVLGERPPR